MRRPYRWTACNSSTQRCRQHVKCNFYQRFLHFLQARQAIEALSAADATNGWQHTASVAPGEARGSRQRGRSASALLVVSTADVWPKTELLLHSLQACDDAFDLLVSSNASWHMCFTSVAQQVLRHTMHVLLSSLDVLNPVHLRSRSRHTRRSTAATTATLPKFLLDDQWTSTCRTKHDESMRMDLQALDELSDDGTPQQLAALGIRTLQPAERRGVTHNWNMVRPHRTCPNPLCSLGGVSEVDNQCVPSRTAAAVAAIAAASAEARLACHALLHAEQCGCQACHCQSGF